GRGSRGADERPGLGVEIRAKALQNRPSELIALRVPLVGRLAGGHPVVAAGVCAAERRAGVSRLPVDELTVGEAAFDPGELAEQPVDLAVEVEDGEGVLLDASAACAQPARQRR